MQSLKLIAEFEEATTKEDARALLDAFRESVYPGMEYGITIYEDSPPRPGPLPEVLRDARDAFWDVIAATHPEITTGDFPPEERSFCHE